MSSRLLHLDRALAEGFARAFRGVFLWGLPMAVASLWVVSRLREVPLRESVGEADPLTSPRSP